MLALISSCAFLKRSLTCHQEGPHLRVLASPVEPLTTILTCKGRQASLEGMPPTSKQAGTSTLPLGPLCDGANCAGSNGALYICAGRIPKGFT